MIHQRKKYVTYIEGEKRVSIAVIVCQSAIRQFLAVTHTWHLREVKCATLIQSTWRRFLASEYFIFVVSDVIVCQSVARRMIASVRYKSVLAKREMVSAAAKIQAAYVGYTARKNYLLAVNCVVTCQRAARRMMAIRELQELRQLLWAKEFVRKETAATKIRAAYLGYIARSDYFITISSVITLQGAVRVMIAKNMARVRRMHVQWDKEVRAAQHHKGATLIQATWRRYFASKQEMAAVSIQKTYRGFGERLMYRVLLADVITTQTIVRRWSAIRQLYMRRLSQMARKGSATKARENNAATKIRGAYLGYTARISFLIMVKRVITCQSAIRAMAARKQLLIARDAATKIQSAYHGYYFRMEYIVTVNCVIACQAAVRRMLAQKKLGELRNIQDAAATKIRAAYLGYISRVNYALTVVDIVTIQKSLRGYHARKVVAVVRGRHLLDVKAATRIQSCWRCFKAQSDYAFLICGLISLQAKIRQLLAKMELTRRRRHWHEANHCATRIQSCWRSYKAQVDYAIVILAVISIQSFIRMCSALKKRGQLSVLFRAESLMNLEKGGVLAIQERWKEFSGRKRIVSERIILENKAATAIVSEMLIIHTTPCVTLSCFLIHPILLVRTLPLLFLLAILLPWVPRLPTMCLKVGRHSQNSSLYEKI